MRLPARDEGAWANKYPDWRLLSQKVPDHPVVLALASQVRLKLEGDLEAAHYLALRAVEQADEDLLREAEIIGGQTFESADYAEGRSAFVERRRPRFQGR